MSTKKPYLTVCAVYRDEAPYLREWVAFHEIGGVDHFILYNHASSDAHEEALAPFVKRGLVEVHDWPDVMAPQHDIYDRVLEERRDDSRWIAFIDLDEFLFSPSGQALPQVLREYERFPGVAVNWVVYGTSGHRAQPPGLVIENYLFRASDTAEYYNRRFKSIVDPFRTARCEDCHHFQYREAQHVVDENTRFVEEPITDQPSFARLRINHYWTKSAAELRKKFSRPRASDGLQPPLPQIDVLDADLNAERDEAILRYAPAVRAALEQIGDAPPPSPGPALSGPVKPVRKALSRTPVALRRPRLPPAEPSGNAYLSICAAFRDEARYLQEWIEFHRLVGAERFYLYDHGSGDDPRRVLEPYVEAGTVVWRDWPGDAPATGAQDDCIRATSDAWVALLGIDEFLFAHTHQPLTEILGGYEGFGAIRTELLTFAGSENKTGLVIDKQTARGATSRIETRIFAPRKSIDDGASPISASELRIHRYARSLDRKEHLAEREDTTLHMYVPYVLDEIAKTNQRHRGLSRVT